HCRTARHPRRAEARRTHPRRACGQLLRSPTMTLRRWFFNVTPSGTTLTTANVLAADSTAASAVSAGTGGTIASSNAHVHHGDTSARFLGGGTNTQVIRLPFAAASASGALSVYHWGGTLGAVDIVNVRHASGQLFRIGIS